MNELKLDYSKKGKQSLQLKRLLVIAGLVMIGFSLATLAMVIFNDLKPILIVPAIANLWLGIHFILQSIEHKILYPKKYINISNEVIEFKLGGFYKEQRIEWASISRVSEQRKSLVIYSGARAIKINMLHFPSLDEKRIRSTINTIAEAKQL